MLNARLKVRAETAQKVAEAAQKIGYHAQGLIESRIRADLPQLRLGFILQKEDQSFYQDFQMALESAVVTAPGVNASARFEFVQGQSPDELAEKIVAMNGRVDAVAAMSINHARITAAVTELKESGIPTFSLLSDFAQGARQHYIGTNNLKVGRIAAWMLATAAKRPGKIALFVGGYRWHGHELRETGFRSYFREFQPQFQMLDTLVNLETRRLTYEATLDLLHRHPDVAGIYLAGGGMEGAIEALREIREAGQISLVVNELTPESRAALSDRYVTMVISTPLQQLCADLVRVMSDSVLADVQSVPGQLFLDPHLVVPESV